MKKWFLTNMINMCNFSLKYSEGADDQGEINEMVKIKNYFIKELEKLHNKK